MIDIDHFLAADPSGANGVLRIVNIYGFFIEGMGDVDVNTGAMTLNTGGSAVIRANHDHPVDVQGQFGAPSQRVIFETNHSHSLSEVFVVVSLTIVGSRDPRLEDLGSCLGDW